jgi:hypothetical protein
MGIAGADITNQYARAVVADSTWLARSPGWPEAHNSRLAHCTGLHCRTIDTAELTRLNRRNDATKLRTHNWKSRQCYQPAKCSPADSHEHRSIGQSTAGGGE